MYRSVVGLLEVLGLLEVNGLLEVHDVLGILEVPLKSKSGTYLFF